MLRGTIQMGTCLECKTPKATRVDRAPIIYYCDWRLAKRTPHLQAGFPARPANLQAVWWKQSFLENGSFLTCRGPTAHPSSLLGLSKNKLCSGCVPEASSEPSSACTNVTVINKSNRPCVAPRTVPTEPPPALARPSPAQVSSNEAGWQAAIHTVRLPRGSQNPGTSTTSARRGGTCAAGLSICSCLPMSHPCRLMLLQVVHRLGRHFGFQAFNLDPRSEVGARHAVSCQHGMYVPETRARAAGAVHSIHTWQRHKQGQAGSGCSAMQAHCWLALPRRLSPPAGSLHPPQGKEPVYVPATIFLVTDHLYHLLVKNYMRRDKAEGGCWRAQGVPPRWLGSGRARGCCSMRGCL